MLVANPFKTEAESELRDEHDLRPYATTKLKNGKRTAESTDPLLLSNYANKHPELSKTPLILRKEMSYKISLLTRPLMIKINH